MENQNIVLWAVVALIIGAVGGAQIFPTEDTSKVDALKADLAKKSDSFTDLQKELFKLQNAPEPEPKVINNTIEKTVEVDWLQNAVDEFLVAAEDEEDEAGNEVYILECDGHEYDFDDIEISKHPSNNLWAMHVDDDRRMVDFEVRLKYDEEDERSCRETYKVWVLWEEDEDTEIKAELA